MSNKTKAEYWKAVGEWKKTRKAADEVMDKMGRKPNEPIYILTKEDVDVIRRNWTAWEKVKSLARGVTEN